MRYKFISENLLSYHSFCLSIANCSIHLLQFTTKKLIREMQKEIVQETLVPSPTFLFKTIFTLIIIKDTILKYSHE